MGLWRYMSELLWLHPGRGPGRLIYSAGPTGPKLLKAKAGPFTEVIALVTRFK